jgi:hypothetical protein
MKGELCVCLYSIASNLSFLSPEATPIVELESPARDVVRILFFPLSVRPQCTSPVRCGIQSVHLVSLISLHKASSPRETV